MPTSTPSPPLYTTYRTSLANRLVLGIVLPVMLLAFGYVLFTTWQRHRELLGAELVLLGGMILAEVFMLYALLALFKNAIIITDGRIIEQNAWPLASKELRLEEIAGFRSIDKVVIIFPTQPYLPKLTVAKSIEYHDDFQFWLGSNYPDLDHREAEATRALLLADEQLGSTPEARAARLMWARRVSRVLNVLGGLLAAWLSFGPKPSLYALAAGMAAPLLVIGALFAFPGVMRFQTGKNHPQASAPLGLLLPILPLLAQTLADAELVFSSAAWPLVGGVALAFGGLLVTSSRTSLLAHGTLRRGSGNEWVFLIMCAAAYGYGVTLTSNVAFDNQAPTLYQAQVSSKYLTRGKNPSYNLTLSPWGPRITSEDVTVKADYYSSKQPGDSVTIAIRPGRLGIAWFRVVEQ